MGLCGVGSGAKGDDLSVQSIGSGGVGLSGPARLEGSDGFTELGALLSHLGADVVEIAGQASDLSVEGSDGTEVGVTLGPSLIEFGGQRCDLATLISGLSGDLGLELGDRGLQAGDHADSDQRRRAAP